MGCVSTRYEGGARQAGTVLRGQRRLPHAEHLDGPADGDYRPGSSLKHFTHMGNQEIRETPLADPAPRGGKGLFVQRVCFLLKVRQDRLDAYRRRHADVWPQMCAALSAAGWRNYSLFLRDDGLLVGYLETDDFDRARAAMERTEVNSRWQAEMAPYFEALDGAAPDAAMVPLTEVFHLP